MRYIVKFLIAPTHVFLYFSNSRYSQEQEFWKFIKICFAQPRRLRNNLVQTHYKHDLLSDDILALRSQQMSMADFVRIWKVLNPFLEKENKK